MTASLLIVIFFLSSCGDKKAKEDSANNKQNDTINLFLSAIPDSLEFESQVKAQGFAAPKVKESKYDLGLPTYFVERQFIKNPVGYIYRLESVVGNVVKINDDGTYSGGISFKKDSVKISAGKPTSPTLAEVKYDSKKELAAKYLVASASLAKDESVQMIVTDLMEAVIEDSQVDLDKLFKVYGKDKDSTKYYLVKSAVSTSILYKVHSKTEIKSDVNFTAAIQVGGKYFKETSNFKQDFKVGTYATPITEYFKLARKK